MKIKLTYVGWLQFKGVKSGSIIDVDEDSTINDLMARYDIPRQQRRFITPFVNEREEKLGYLLQPDDEVTMVIAIGGG